MLFWVLYLAHIAGDFPLQTDTVYKIKMRSSWGVIPHVVICSIANIVFLYPLWGHLNTWAAILLLGLIHTFLDKTKIVLSSRTSNDSLFNFLLDQLLHLFSILLVAFWLDHVLEQQHVATMIRFYNKNVLVISSALLLASFAGVPFTYYTKKYWMRRISGLSTAMSYPRYKDRFSGMVERTLATAGLVLGSWWLFLSVLIFLPRILASCHTEKKAEIIIEQVCGFFVSLLCGAIVLLFA